MSRRGAMVVLGMLVMAACAQPVAECPRSVLREFDIDPIRGVIGFTDGTLVAANAFSNELSIDRPGRERIAVPIDGNTVGGVDAAAGLLWLTHGGTAQRVDVYDMDTLELQRQLSFADRTPVAAHQANAEHVIIQFHPAAAQVIRVADFASVAELTSNGPAVEVAGLELGILDRTVVELGCRR